MAGISFSGNGYLQQNLTDNQFKMTGDFHLEIVFTTLKENGTIVKVADHENVRFYTFQKTIYY